MEFLECAPSGLLGRLLLRNWDSFLCLGAVFFFFFAPMSLLPLAPHWGLGLTFFRVKFDFRTWHLSIFVYYIFGSVGLAAIWTLSLRFSMDFIFF